MTEKRKPAVTEQNKAMIPENKLVFPDPKAKAKPKKKTNEIGKRKS